jgi:uncharacterized protein
MHNRYFAALFTPAVQAEQARHGSQQAYARMNRPEDETVADRLTGAEAAFIAARDSFYLATVSESGWPYLQHRGGPAGFVQVLDEATLAWPDFTGNRQYVSIGNVAGEDRVSLFFMDYARRRRLKVLGRLRVLESAADPELASALEPRDYGAKVQHIMQVKVEAFDWNCPQHITPRFTAEEVDRVVGPLEAEIAELKARLAAAGSIPV